jgi:thiol:disulfide interchange protein DsbG
MRNLPFSLPVALILSLALMLFSVAPAPAADHTNADSGVSADAAEQREREAQVWDWAEQSHWIQDGDPDAPRILYTFTDPNCPYCRQFWQATRPWVEAGEVQLRHIMVGILAPDSPAKAATLLAAGDPASALQSHYHDSETLEGLAQSREIEERIYDNNQLFDTLGLVATPTTLYRNGDRLAHVQGMPEEQTLIEMMGSE